MPIVDAKQSLDHESWVCFGQYFEILLTFFWTTMLSLVHHLSLLYYIDVLCYTTMLPSGKKGMTENFLKDQHQNKHLRFIEYQGFWIFTKIVADRQIWPKNSWADWRIRIPLFTYSFASAIHAVMFILTQ